MLVTFNLTKTISTKTIKSAISLALLLDASWVIKGFFGRQKLNCGTTPIFRNVWTAKSIDSSARLLH